MNIQRTIKLAMIDKDINGVMELVEFTGVSYSLISKLLRGDNTVSLSAAVEVLGLLGYELRAVVK